MNDSISDTSLLNEYFNNNSENSSQFDEYSFINPPVDNPILFLTSVLSSSSTSSQSAINEFCYKYSNITPYADSCEDCFISNTVYNKAVLYTIIGSTSLIAIVAMCFFRMCCCR